MRRPGPDGLLLVALALTGLVPACREEPAPPSARPSVGGSPQAPAPADDLAAARALLTRGRWAEAAAAFAPLRAAAERAGDEERRFWAGLGWARAEYGLGHPDAVRSELAILRGLALGSPQKEAWIASLGSHLRARGGEPDGAVEEARHALDLARQAGDEDLEAFAGDTVGTALSLAGRYREAVAVNEERVRRWRALPGRARYLADALNDLGIDHRHFGRLEDAIAVYEEATRLYRALGDDEGVARVLYNLSNIYILAGDLDRGLDLKLESLPLAEKIGSAFGLGLLHADLGELYRHHRNFARARHHLEKALAIHRQAGQVYGELQALFNLAHLALDTGAPELARARLLEALARSEPTTLRKDQALVRSELARAEAALGHGHEALRWAQEARVRAAALAEPWMELEALTAWALALEAAEDPGGAAAAYLEGMGLLESSRGRVALGDLRLGFAESYLAIYEGAIRCLLAEGRPVETFEVGERARARLLLELMAERGVRPGDAGGSQAAALRQRLRAQALGLGRARGEQARTLQAEVDAMAQELARLEATARESDPAAAVRHPAPATLPEIRRELLADGRALLGFFWGERDVYGWWATASALRAANLGPAAGLAAQVSFLRAALEDPASAADWHLPARRLYDRLIAPLRPTPAREILVLADGPLAYLPVEVLLPAPGAVPWGVTHRILYGPSASVLAALAAAPPPPAAEGTLLALGYSPPARRRGAREGGRDAEAPSEPIPYAVREARQAAALFGAGRAASLVGAQASLSNWESLHPERYRYLHFAAHARVSDRRPDETHLLLAGGGLRLPAIRRLHLNADLVILSACDTGLGRRVRGEGVIGLPHAFLAAGARGAVVALWRVDDRRAKDFMLDFYGELREGRPPAEALRRVRAAWATAADEKSHPARWAPFVLVGGG